VLISGEALRDLERIVAYIAPHNAVAAEKMGNHLLDAALSLSKSPERGRVVPEFHRPELREIIFRSYRKSFTGQTTRRRAGRLSASGMERADSRKFPAKMVIGFII
jgi:plasmid stabilization system protein ParE